MVWLFFSFYTFFEFSKYSTENNIAFIIEQKEQCLLFSDTKAPLPLQCGNSAKILFLDSISERALGLLLGAAAEACHIWKPSIRMTSPLEPIQHKPCLQELAEIFGQNLEGRKPRKNWPKEERTGLLACRSPLYPSGLSRSLWSVPREGLLSPSHSPPKKNSHNGQRVISVFFLGPEWDLGRYLCWRNSNGLLVGERSGNIT